MFVFLWNLDFVVNENNAGATMVKHRLYQVKCFLLPNSCRFHNNLEKSGGGEHSTSDLPKDRILSNVDDALMIKGRMKVSSWVLGLGGDPESHESKLPPSVWLGKTLAEPWRSSQTPFCNKQASSTTNRSLNKWLRGCTFCYQAITSWDLIFFFFWHPSKASYKKYGPAIKNRWGCS